MIILATIGVIALVAICFFLALRLGFPEWIVFPFIWVVFVYGRGTAKQKLLLTLVILILALIPYFVKHTHISFN